jgi:hypothetical protein
MQAPGRGATMKTPDASIPAPAAAPDQPVLPPADRPWSRPIVAELDYHRWLKEAAVNEPALVDAATVEELPPIGDELTLYEAAMLYANRHPYPEEFGPYDDTHRRERCLTLLNVGAKQGSPHARLSCVIFRELQERTRRGEIKPIRIAYDETDTVISTGDLANLADERGDPPACLIGYFQAKRVPLPKLRTANSEQSKAAAWALRNLYGTRGYRRSATVEQLTRAVNAELRKLSAPAEFKNMEVSRLTVGRVLGHYGAEQN